jgi:hypothetical protein
MRRADVRQASHARGSPNVVGVISGGYHSRSYGPKTSAQVKRETSLTAKAEESRHDIE